MFATGKEIVNVFLMFVTGRMEKFNDSLAMFFLQNLGKFGEIDFPKFAKILLDNNQQFLLAAFLYKFKELDNTVAMILVNEGYKLSVLDNLDSFSLTDIEKLSLLEYIDEYSS